MKEYFVITDVHSFYSIMMAELLKKGFDINNKDHILISCGDNFDRGQEAKEMLKFLYQMYTQDRAILVKGNHESLFEEMVDSGYPSSIDFSNGTYSTLLQLQPKMKAYEFDMNHYNHQIDQLIKEMKDYYETPHYIFVHGWIPIGKDDYNNLLYDPEWRAADPDRFESARWLNGMDMAMHEIIEPNKIIVCGHWHTSWGNVRKENPGLSSVEYKKLADDKNKFYPYEDEGIIAFDACTAYTKKCNILHFFENEL